MKKTYSKSSRQGLPGGPNEMFEKVKGIIVSERGQWDFPGMNTLVPTDDGRITMRGVPYPVYGEDETGYGQMMYPGQEYQFPGNNVLELPMAQNGVEKTSWVDYINPYNWGVTNRDDAGDFKKAFRAARIDGDDQFIWHGKRYSTKLTPASEEERPKSNVLDLDNALDYLVETRGGTRDLWGHMADTIGYHESGHTMDPLQMQNSGGPGRGIFQFEAPSLITAQNRYKRIADRLKLKPDPKILSAKSALELSPEQQYSLFLINLSESQAKLKDYVDNKLPLVDLWLQGHKRIEKDENRGSFRTSVQKAKDKSIQKGYDSFKQLGGALPQFQYAGQFNPQLARPNPLTGKYAWEQSIPKKAAVNVAPKIQPAARATTNVQKQKLNLDRDNRLLDANLIYSDASSNPLSNAVHTGLDAVGMVPLIGEPADLANALLYNYEGDLENAALSTAGMIPFLGMLGTGKRLLGKATNQLEGYSKGLEQLAKLPVIDYAKEFGHSIKKGKLPTYESIYRWQPDVFPESLVNKGKTLTPLQQGLTGSWYTKNPGQLAFYMRARPGAGNVNKIRLSDRQIANLESSMPDYAKGMSGKVNSVPTSKSAMPGELIVPESIRSKSVPIRFQVNPIDYSPQSVADEITRRKSYRKNLLNSPYFLPGHIDRTIQNEVIEEHARDIYTPILKAQEQPILRIPRKYFPFQGGGSLPKAQVGDEIFPGEGQYYNIPEYTYNYKRGFDDLPDPVYSGPLMSQRLIDEATQREYEQRRRAIEESVAAAREPLSTQRLARESAATGDKFSLQMNLGDPYNNPRLYETLGALDFINPGVMLGDMVTGLGSVPYNVQEGNYGAAAVGLGLPLATGALASIGVKTPRQFVNNLVNPVAGIGDTPKQLPGSPNTFKSEIDWGKWNPDTPKYPELINEYNAIEESTKKAGTWMKNPDGSAFQGTPEQFIQQQSSWFKKAFGDSKLVNPDGSPWILEHGSPKKFDTFDESKFQLGDSGYSGSGIYTVPPKGSASSYTTSGTWMHKGDIEPTLYKLYGLGKNPITSEELIKMGANSPAGKEMDLFNFHRKSAPLNEQLLDYDVAIHNQNRGIERVRDLDDAWEVVFPTNKQLKSATGNVGFFDMTNPNIYKALAPVMGIGAGAYGVNQMQDAQPTMRRFGGKLRYARGGSLTSAQDTAQAVDLNQDVMRKDIKKATFAEDFGAAAYGVWEGTLDALTFGLTDDLTDAGFKALQTAAGHDVNSDEAKRQAGIKGWGNVGGAVTGALVNPASAFSAGQEGLEGIGQGIQGINPSNQSLQAVGKGVEGLGNIQLPKGMESMEGMSKLFMARNGGRFKYGYRGGGHMVNQNMGLTEIDGPSHEQGGVTLPNSGGRPDVEVEGPETIYTPENYVMSEKMKASKEALEYAGITGKAASRLAGKSYADLSKSIKSKAGDKLRPADPLSKKMLDKEMKRLMMAHEYDREAKRMKDEAMRSQMMGGSNVVAETPEERAGGYNMYPNAESIAFPGSGPTSVVPTNNNDPIMVTGADGSQQMLTDEPIETEAPFIEQKMAQGGKMIKRADGSYSRTGLWDNIRANRGSGRKPTKQMLEQEAKIKAAEKAYGGYYADGGSFDNPGFRALPSYVQAKIKSNMALGGDMAGLGMDMETANSMQGIGNFLKPITQTLNNVADIESQNNEYQMQLGGFMGDYIDEDDTMEYGSGGYTVRRSNDRKGKTHVVTGPDGTKKYFGDPKLGERGKSKYGKDAFYARHKKNLAKNPYFRAYARATWEDGGYMNMLDSNVDMVDMETPMYEYGGSMMYGQGGGIHIDPSKRGTFKAQASRMGMGVQQAASSILNAPEGKYSPAMRKKANFARNFAKADGGYMYQMGGEMTPQQAPQQGGDQEQIMQAIVEMLQQGLQPEQIVGELVKMGIPQEAAIQAVQMVMQQVQQSQGMQQQQAAPPFEQGMMGQQQGAPATMRGGGRMYQMGGSLADTYLQNLNKPKRLFRNGGKLYYQDAGLLPDEGYAAINKFENTMGTYDAQGNPIGMGRGNQYAQTEDKDRIESFIDSSIGRDTWDKLPDDVKTQMYSFMFNTGKYDAALSGLAQAINNSTGGGDLGDERRGYTRDFSVNAIKGADFNNPNLYSNYVNVLGDQYNSIADNTKKYNTGVGVNYAPTLRNRPISIHNNLYPSGYSFPSSTSAQPAAVVPQVAVAPTTTQTSAGTGVLRLPVPGTDVTLNPTQIGLRNFDQARANAAQNNTLTGKPEKYQEWQPNTAPIVAGGLSAGITPIANLVASITGRDTRAAAPLKFEKPDYTPVAIQRAAANQALANTREALRRGAPTQGNYLSNLAITAPSLAANVGREIANKRFEIGKSRAEIDMREQAANDIIGRFNIMNQGRDQAAREQLRLEAAKGFSTIGQGVTKDLGETLYEADILRNLETKDFSPFNYTKDKKGRFKQVLSPRGAAMYRDTTTNNQIVTDDQGNSYMILPGGKIQLIQKK